MQALWQSILNLSALVITPDWGALIGLLPVFLAIGVVLWFLMVAYRFATVGPTRRGPRRLPPRPPAGVHMPGGSLAPVFTAVGLFLLFFGLVVKGPALILGVAALSLTLLYWGAEAIREHDRLVAEPNLLPAVAARQPPPGVHMPGPSFRPLLGALAMGLLFFGFVFGGWVLASGVLAMVITLLGWLGDARKEYVKTEEADETGHLGTLPAPRYPKRLLGAFAVVVLFAGLLQAGILPPKSPAAGGAAGASGAPGTSGGPAGSGAPGTTADLSITAKDIAFNTKALTAPAANKPFTVALDNLDTGVPHDFTVKDGSGKVLFHGTRDDGGVTIEDVPALAAGSYTFYCSFHPIPSMTGTLTVP